MLLTSNEPVRLYSTTKTPKIENFDHISIDKLKFSPIMDQTSTFTYDAAKLIGKYLKPLAKKEYKINDCQEFPDMFKNLPTLKDNKVYVSYDIDSLFTNIPLKDTVECVIH